MKKKIGGIIIVGTVCLLVGIIYWNVARPKGTILNADFTWDCTKVSKDSFDLKSIYRSYTLIPLELNEKSTIGAVDKVVFVDSLVFVMDRFIASGVFVFDAEDGSFIEQIGDVGNGHGDYIELYDFSIDEERQRVYVLCNRGTVMAFSLDGKYIEEKELPFPATNVEYSNDRFYFVTECLDKDNLYITDMNLNILKSYFPNSDYGENYRWSLLPFQKLKEGVLYRRFLDYHIYKVDKNGELSALYEFDLGVGALFIEDVRDLPNSQLKKLTSSSTYQIKFFVDTPDYAEILFNKNKESLVAIYDKVRNDVNVYEYSKMKNILGNLDYPLPKYDGLGRKAYMILYYEDIAKLVEEGILDTETYSKDSNPIICVFNQ